MEKNEILILHGTEYRQMAKQILAAAKLADRIGSHSSRIGLKPNMVTPSDPSDGATTHPELIAGTIEYLQENGFQDIAVMEGAWAGARTSDAIRAIGYDRLCRNYGVKFVDLQKDSASVHDAAGMDIRICDAALAVDFMINVPVLKGHCQTNITCALKNNKGILPNSEKRRFHTMGLHRPIAHLNTVARNDFILVDNICGDLDFEEGGNPVQMNRVLAFADPVLCDAYVCDCMGYELSDVPYIGLAEQLGVGSADLSAARVICLNEADGADTTDAFPMTRRVRTLAAFVEAKDACSVCYGSLIYALHRLDENGMLRRGLPKLAIGQGYRGTEAPDRIGIGRCTSGCGRCLQQCPPSAASIRTFLEENWIVR